MKQNDLTDVSYQLAPQNYENIFSVYTDEDNYYYYNLLRVINFPQDLDTSYYSTYTTITNDTWPTISWKFYKTVKLWWVICSVNQIINPIDQPVAGTSLKILNLNVVRNLLNTIKTE